MHIQKKHRCSWGIAVCTIAWIIAGSDTPALAVPEIHVRWNLPGTPTPGVHYAVDYTDPDHPDIELITGDITWQVWSKDSVTGKVSDIGNIEAYGEADYGLILGDYYGGPGARNVGSIILDPAGYHNSGIAPWDYTTNSAITGSVTGDVYLSNEGSIFGGYCSLVVSGDVSGTWDAPGSIHVVIEGSVTSTAELNFGIILGGFLEIDGDVDGDITVLEGLHSQGGPAWVQIGGDLNADLNLGSITASFGDV